MVNGRKRVSQSTKYGSVNRLVWEWFKDASSRQINLSGPSNKERAMEFANSIEWLAGMFQEPAQPGVHQDEWGERRCEVSCLFSMLSLVI